jgi:thioesterase domain-containing protein
MGGVVALEMAQQLRAAGRDVPLLVAIDAPLLDAEQQVPGDAAIHEFLLAEMGGQLPNDFDVADLVERFRGGDTGPSEIELHLAVVEANLAAHQHYRAKPYDGNVLLFRPQESLAAALPNAASQWQRLVTGELQVHDTPGNHYTMLKSPHVEVLARQIAESIEGTR